MSKEGTPSTPSAVSVSVADAFGLPANWNMRDALAGKVTPPEPAVVDHGAGETATPEAAPAETPAEETPSSENPDTPETPEGEPAATPPAAPAKPVAAAKPGEKPADGKPTKPAKAATTKPAKPAAAKPGEKPAAPAKPAAAAPTTPPAAPAAPAAPPTPPKIKIGDKEYTEDEVKAALAAKAAPAPAAPATPPVAPAAPAKKEPTPEERAAQAADAKKKETEWIASTAAAVEAPLDEATLDKIMTGGEEGVKALQELRQRDVATAVLMARKSIYAEMQPVLDEIRAAQRPLLSQFEQAENLRMENEFKKAYPALADKFDAVQAVTDILVKNRPQEVAQMTEPQFFAAVAAETDRFLKALGVNPAATPASTATPPVADPAAPPAAAAPAAPVATPPAAPAKPAAPTKPLVKPPGGNTPAGAGAAGKGGKGSDAAIIATLW